MALAGGVRLIVPRGALNEPATVARTAAATPTLPEGVSVGQIVDIAMDAKLSKPVTVTFPASEEDLKAPAGSLVGYHEGPAGTEYLVAKIDREHRRVSLQTASLSPLGFLRINPGAIKDQFSKLVNEFFGGAVESPTTPSCDGEAEALRDGWSATSTNSDTLRWCLGMQDSERVLKVASTRRYPLVVTAPQGAALVGRSDRDFASRISEALSPDNEIVLGGGDDAAWSVDLVAGSQGSFQAEFDGLAQATSSILVAVEWLEFFVSKLPGVRTGGKEALVKRIEESGCLEVFAETDPQGTFGADDAFRLVKGCLTRDTIGKWAGRGVAAIIFAPVALVFGTADYFRGVWQGITNTVSGNSSYVVTVKRAEAVDAPDSADNGTYSLASCRRLGTPAISDEDKFERLASCLHIALQQDDRDLASRFAEPEAVTTLFSLPLAPPWNPVGCEERADGGWLSIRCDFYQQIPGESVFNVYSFYPMAWDDVTTISRIEAFTESAH